MSRLISQLVRQNTWFFGPLGIAVAYGLWIAAFRTISVSIISYFLITSGSNLQDLGDALSSNEVSLMGTSALLFLILWTSFQTRRIRSKALENKKANSWFPNRLQAEKQFFPGFITGSVFACVTVFLFLLVEQYRYLGSPIEFFDAPYALANIFLRMLTLLSLAWCEEIIFHHPRFKPQTKKLVPISILWSAVLYCGIKALQFDLGLLQNGTLFLVSVALHSRNFVRNSFVYSAGLWGGILIVFHPLLSLPIFGNDFTGALLVKYRPEVLLFSSSDLGISWTRFVTGGPGGPLSSIIVQGFLLADIIKRLVFRKRSQNESLTGGTSKFLRSTS